MVNATANYAFDKKSARSFDADGRMRVRDCVISVGEINPYYGREIPNYKALGLDANKVYDLYRDPAELERAAPSFNGPLMIRHVAQTANEPRKEYIGGTVYDVRYADGKVWADLLVMDQQAIDYVQSGELADLSSSYRYTADMTPGEVNGRKYDGRMTDIQGNHVALVEDGRATGAHVADSALSSQPGATNVDPNENPNTSPAPESGAGAAEALMMITAKLEAIESRLTAVEGGKVDTPQSEAKEGVPASVNTASDEQSEKDRKDEREGEERAMDAKIGAAVNAAVDAERKRAAGVAAAKQACRGDLGDMIAMDDAGEIYRAALKQRGVDVSAIPAGAEQATYQAIQSVGRPAAAYANDSNSGSGKPAFDTSRIRRLGRA
ncbi:head maturation protease [Xanthomonas virus phiXaf18]|uniref:DUF2213 domain-containing protein n=2 Tax=root TaxID=1 RepID=A0A5P8PQN1_9CAUD|nr:head maturation protease [Xanthomonas virus phiXaf18]QFR59565.1 hypothetical protein phiXaf18_6 [Xanthomonas virus phiXaf18]